ncbi:hypothetical protein FRC10_004195, partial [Ceratobasidium sp. 414]
MHRLFETQELVAMICSSLCTVVVESGVKFAWEIEQLRRTALVSIHFFHGMLPYLWEHVNIRDLFGRGLVPAKLVEKRGKTRVRILKSVSDKTMTRFHFYAPYIKVLRVPIGDHATDIVNWEPLAAYSKNNELLPNLVKLECEEFDPHTVSVFLSSSVQKVTVGGPSGEDSDGSDSDSDVPLVPRKVLDITSTAQLLEYTAQKCPDLHSLEFHPESDEIVDTPTYLQTFTLLSSFKHLRRLTSTPMLLESAALQLVAQLPSLDTLSAEPNEHSGHWNPSLCEQVPAGGFPALNDLTLCLEGPWDAEKFWELIPLQALKTLALTIDSYPDDNESRFIPVLCRASPLITGLTLRFSGWGHRITADTFEYLARLPIESYSFPSTSFNFGNAWAKIAGSWPNLRSIKGYPSVDLDDLLFLSSNLPKLEFIECDFDLYSAARKVESNWLPVGRPPFYPNLKHSGPLRSNFRMLTSSHTLRGLARYIAYFWPNMSIKYIKPSDWKEYIDHDGKDLRRMNQEIAAANKSMFVMFEELILSYVYLFHPDLVGTPRD